MKRYYKDIKEGLSTSEVNERISLDLVNHVYSNTTRSIKSIILKNIFTYFNILNFFLGILVFLANSYKNMLFLGVIVCNTLISLVSEIKSKKILDKLSLLSLGRVTVIRDGKEKIIEEYELVLDDLMVLSSGKSVPTDAIIVSGECDVNEAILTGEEDSTHKKCGDLLYSGSFLVSDKVIARVEHVGNSNYMFKVTEEAKHIKASESFLMNFLNKIIKYISVFIVPLGLLLFYNQIKIGTSLNTSIINSVAGVISMIPTGLVLLTSTVLMLSAVRLAKKSVLVQDLYCTEMLARVDNICFDKTGTITTGNMEVVDLVKLDKDDSLELLNKVLVNLDNDNSTMMALKKKYEKNIEYPCTNKIPFSSKYKYSSVSFKDDTYLLGAPDVLVKDIDLTKYKDYRVLLFAHTKDNFKKGDIPKNIRPLALILLKDEIRDSAKDTIKYFYDNDVNVRIISGDNVFTIEKIAREVGVKDVKVLDTSRVSEEELFNIASNYNVFGRVTPSGKKIIIKALKKEGHVIAYAGDGINDVLALKEANCSIALASGTDAVRNVSSLVLLSSSFSSIIDIVKEGRRSINNLGRSATLFLSKTLYSALLTILFIFLNTNYPFVPIHISLLSFVTIGVPSFVLAMEPNDKKVDNDFILNIVKRIIAPAITVVLDMLIMTILKDSYSLEVIESSTICVTLIAFIGFILIYKISKPLNLLRSTLLVSMTFIFSLGMFVFRDLFSLSIYTKDMAFLVLILMVVSLFIYNIFEYLVNFIFKNKK